MRLIDFDSASGWKEGVGSFTWAMKLKIVRGKWIDAIRPNHLTLIRLCLSTISYRLLLSHSAISSPTIAGLESHRET